MSYTVLIPARLASTRLPNKPLLEMGGLPMVVQVAKRVASAYVGEPRPDIIVAADHPLIVQTCKDHGVEAILTDETHLSGSDRLAQACQILGLDNEDLVVNVQGDEPLIEGSLVRGVAQCLQDSKGASMATAAHAISSTADFLNPNVVKVVMRADHRALYFSRAPIPWWRDGFNSHGDLARTLTVAQLPSPEPLRHIGIYAYKAHFLRRFPGLAPAPLEQLEALEQLRALWHGYEIAVLVTDQIPMAGVDTPEDLERVRNHYNQLETDK